MTKLFEARNFSFSYPFNTGTIRVEGELIINRGDIILLQGASGSGKSTLLQALKGLIPQEIYGKLSGEILFNGRPLNQHAPAELATIGYLQQNPASQLVCRNVFAEIAFGLENLGFQAEEIQQRVAALANQLQISHLLTRDPTTLSGGEQQKIALAAILVMEPQVLLLDEPTAFLDPESAKELMTIVKQCCRGRTVVIIEHNLAYVADLVTRCFYLNTTGQLEEQELAKVDWQPQLADYRPPARPVTPSPLLQLTALSYTYPKQSTPTLKNIQLTLHAGSITAITGRNGAGKSTLLKLLIRSLPSQPVTIWWQGQDLARLPLKTLWRQIRLLWQNPETHFLATSVAQELTNNQQLISEFDLAAQLNNNPFSLSQGQKRRLSLAIATSQPAALLLLDEPTFGQDQVNKAKLASYLQNIAAQGVAILMVSHDQQFIASLANQVYQLNNGELLACR